MITIQPDGTWWYGLWNILFHGKLLESRDPDEEGELTSGHDCSGQPGLFVATFKFALYFQYSEKIFITFVNHWYDRQSKC